MTKPKLKPCPFCEGKGKKYLQVFNETMECAYCNGTGKLPMTNEEYLRSLNTEQLAWFIAKAMLFYDNTIMSLLEAIKKAIEYEQKSSDYFTDDIVEWLKQPHTTKE